ncbi:sugar MFS transporter [soil metagenome]
MVESKSTNTKAMMIIGMLFFIFGFVTWLNGTLIPFLKLACELENDIQAFFVTFAFYMAYFFLALPSAMILKKTGFKNGMALGLLVMAIGSLIFIPAAQSRSFVLFLCGLFVQGAGLALLQTASNPYISIIGPVESAAKRISIMGICNKTAGALSPLIVGAIVLKNASSIEAQIKTATDAVVKENLLAELAGRVIVPYAIMAVVLTLLAFLIKRSSLPDINTDGDASTAEQQAAKTSVFQYPHLLLGVLCLFFCVGAEVMAGDAIGIFGKSIGISLDKTKYFTTFTLIAMLFGYVAGIIAIPKFLSQQKALAISAVLGMLFSLCVYFTSGYTSVTFIALLGLANALMWPAIFPLAIDGLGKFTKTGSGLLVMGIAGGAVIPLIYGTLKDKVLLPNNLSFLICTLPCYIYICFYAVKGYKAGREKPASKKVLQGV